MAMTFEEYDAERESELESLPVCAWCGEFIQTEFLYEVADGLVCENCMDECKHSTENYTD